MRLEEFIPLANNLADISAEILKYYYRNLKHIEHKQDKSPVTIADMEAEEKMRALIMQEFPDHAIYGEEYGNYVPDNHAGYIWHLDPIDGTASFVIGRPIFGSLIGLSFNGKPVMGIINQPVTGDRWVGAEEAYLNGKKINTSSCSKIQDAIIATTGLHYFSNAQQERYINIANKAKLQIKGGDCYNYGLLAAGYVDIVIEAGLKSHDFMAIIPIIKAAGGICTDWSGKEIDANSDGTIIAAANRALFTEIMLQF